MNDYSFFSAPQLKRDPLGRNETMALSFHAESVTAHHHDGTTIVAFADTTPVSNRYLLFQRSDLDDPQDAALGMDTYYIERDDQRYSSYGGVIRLELSPDRLSATLTPDAARRLGTDALEVSFTIDRPTFDNLRAQLTSVFRDRGEVTLVGT